MSSRIIRDVVPQMFPGQTGSTGTVALYLFLLFLFILYKFMAQLPRPRPPDRLPRDLPLECHRWLPEQQFDQNVIVEL